MSTDQIMAPEALRATSAFLWLARRYTPEVAERMLREFEGALLSKLRAPVANGALPPPDAVIGGIPYWDAGHMRLQASAPVADIRDELNRLGMTAHTAMNQDARDMRNIMEDLAERLLALAGRPVTHYEVGRPNGDGTWEAVPVRASPQVSEALVRYCPGCGSVGPVEGKYRDCCPDGNEARMIPQALAEKCRDTFKIAVTALLADAAANDADQCAGDEREPSPTAGMNLGQRIAHVGGRTNAQGYIEFGSPMAVSALIRHVLRDLPDRQQRPGDDDLTLSQQYEDACITANMNALDAARWRAVIGCARIRPLGSAGLEQPEPNNYAHMGLEIWTRYGRDYSPELLAQMDEQNARGRRWLTMFADVAIAAQAAQKEGPA